MPSKGRRRTTNSEAGAPAIVSSPPVERSREQWDAAGYTVAEVARPLRRGLEVQRLNDLAAREDELVPEEAEELYRFRIRRVMSRLRQLARARARGDEESIRAALDDLDERLAELRRLEESRRQVGLASDYPLELDQRQAAIDQLLEMARGRASGLVAGSDAPPPQPTGEVRLPAIPFQANGSDVPVYILAPRSLPADALTRNVDAVAHQGANLRVVHDPSEIQRDAQMPPLVINWGGSEPLPADVVALNRPHAVRIASDQVESVRPSASSRRGPSCDRTTCRSSAPIGWSPSAGTEHVEVARQ